MSGEEGSQKKNTADSTANNGEAEPARVEYDEFGFVKDRLCPYCGSPNLKLSHVDDVGTQFFKCEKCGRYSTLAKTKERKEFNEALSKPV